MTRIDAPACRSIRPRRADCETRHAGFLAVVAPIACLVVVLLLVLGWALLDNYDRRACDGVITKIRVGMSESEVADTMNRRYRQVEGEDDLRRYEREHEREWYRDVERPLSANHAVLVFTASERKAYVYMGADGRVESVLYARRGRDKRFQVLATRR